MLVGRLLLGLSGAATRLWLILVIRSFDEDALITMRYASNIWHGQGWVYNAGQHVLGTTSPLWTALTAPIAGLLRFDNARIAESILGFGFYAAACVLFSRLAQQWSLPVAAHLGWLAVLALHPTLVAESVSGMEASLLVLLIAASLTLAVAGLPVPAMAVAGLAILARPEGVVWAACLVAYIWAVGRRSAIRKGLLVLAAILAPWLTFATWYFGSPIPQSVRAKSGLGAGTSVGQILWRPHDLRNLVVFFSGAGARGLADPAQLDLAVGLLAAMAVGLLVAYRQRNWPILCLGAFWALYLSCYYFGYGVTSFEWYRIAPVMAGSLMAVTGLVALSAVAGAQARHLARSPVLDAIVVGAIIVGLVLSVRREVTFRHDSQDYEDAVRRPTGQWLGQCTPRAATVMLEPIGYVGFFADRRTIDIAGLISPELFGAGRSAAGWAAGAIAREHPDYLVLRGYEVPENRFFATGNTPLFATPAERSAFAQAYVASRTFGNGPDDLVIYARRDGVGLAIRSGPGCGA